MRNDGEVFPDRSVLISRMDETTDLLMSMHDDLAQGNTDLNLLGADNRDPQQDALAYTEVCLRRNCTVPDTRPYARVAGAGLDAIVRVFGSSAKQLAREFR